MQGMGHGLTQNPTYSIILTSAFKIKGKKKRWYFPSLK